MSREATTSPVRALFVERFGESQALVIEIAAESHANGVNSENRGDDHFKWALLICIGFDCMLEESFRDHHGITVPWTELKPWIISFAELGSHKGDVDYLAMLAGYYDDFIQKGTVQ